MTPQTLAVLRVMLDEPSADYYGLELSSALGLKTGTIYPILARLETWGWVDSRKEAIDPAKEKRPPRRLYTLTASGEAEASREIAAQLEQLTPRGGRLGWGLRPGSEPA
jgi:PadR family transcriptional regulator, regulatory protein PadR